MSEEKDGLRHNHATLHWVGEPNRVCGNCQHFEKIPTSKQEHGYCHNLISGRMSTGGKTGFNETCRRGFYPDIVRFPLEKRLNVQP